MRLIAHRGFAAVAPENTIAAILSAGADASIVEFDVRRCGSGELVVIHDETIDRVTNGVGTVADLDLETLQSYSVQGSEERIPTLEEVLAVLPSTVDVNLELKADGIAPDVLDALEGVENRVVCTSFRTTELQRVFNLDPTQPTGLLVGKRLTTPVTTAVELGCDVIGAHARRCLLTRLVPRAKSLGLEVHAWAIPGLKTARILRWRGVDCVSSDRPLSI